MGLVNLFVKCIRKHTNFPMEGVWDSKNSLEEEPRSLEKGRWVNTPKKSLKTQPTTNMKGTKNTLYRDEITYCIPTGEVWKILDSNPCRLGRGDMLARMQERINGRNKKSCWVRTRHFFSLLTCWSMPMDANFGKKQQKLDAEQGKNAWSPLIIDDNQVRSEFVAMVCLCTISLWTNCTCRTCKTWPRYYLISPKNILNM